jgi:hypothetical protein
MDDCQNADFDDQSAQKSNQIKSNQIKWNKLIGKLDIRSERRGRDKRYQFQIVIFEYLK